MSRPNFTASKSELRHWHCSAKLENLSVAWLRGALALLGSMSLICGRSEPIRSLENWIQNEIKVIFILSVVTILRMVTVIGMVTVPLIVTILLMVDILVYWSHPYQFSVSYNTVRRWVTIHGRWVTILGRWVIQTG